jgi:hypothetical protein
MDALQQSATHVGPTTSDQHNRVRLQDPKMDIEIIDSNGAADDLVQLKCAYPKHWHVVKCRIRMAKNSPAPKIPCTVVLTSNPDGMLRFNNDSAPISYRMGDPTATVQVLGDGKWINFTISGEGTVNAGGAVVGSQSVGDTKIEAHWNTRDGKLLESSLGPNGEKQMGKPVTVFWFDAALMSLQIGAGYVIRTDPDYLDERYEVEGGAAVTFTATAQIQPVGLDCRRPQIKRLGLGIMQDVLYNVREQTYDHPSATWDKVCPTRSHSSVSGNLSANGKIWNVPKTITVIETFASVYEMPLSDRAKGNKLYSEELQPFIQANTNVSSISRDTPNFHISRTYFEPIPGRKTGFVTWNRLVSVRLLEEFRTYCVVFNKDTQQHCALSESTWRAELKTMAYKFGVGEKLKPKCSITTPSAPVANPPATGVAANKALTQTTTQQLGTGWEPIALKLTR